MNGPKSEAKPVNSVGTLRCGVAVRMQRTESSCLEMSIVPLNAALSSQRDNPALTGRCLGFLVLFIVLLLAFGARGVESTNAPTATNTPPVTINTAATNAPAATNKGPRAKFKVTGYGVLGDLRLRRIIRLLEVSQTKPEFFDANFMEDSALIIEAKLREDGFLNPRIAIRITKPDGTKEKYVWSETEPLPRPLHASEVRFAIKKGVLYHYRKLKFEGLTAMTEKKALSYFIETSGLIPLKQNRVFSPDRLRRSTSNLEQVLDRMGYQEAGVKTGKLEQDDKTGDVDVTIEVTQGPKFLVRTVRQEAFFPDTNAPPTEMRTNVIDHVYSRWWSQDFSQSVRTNYYSRGYPGTTVAITIERREASGTNVFLDLLARIQTGQRVRVGDVSFKGNERTKESMLAKRVPLETGDWLDRLKAEVGQYRLARLGAFDSVELKYQVVSSNLWDVSYELKEGKRFEVFPLVGYGSYDLLRVGVEVYQYNLWGLAHNTRLRLIQSFKSSIGDYTYTIPEFIGEDVDVFVTGSGLRREEISFTRVEYGGGTGARKYFRDIATDVSVRYNYGLLETTDVHGNFGAQGAQSPLVGEFITDVRHDKRDNPLYPHRGYEILGNFEIASEYLGGEVNFQRVDLGGSYHLPLGDSTWFHLGLRHGVVATVGGSTAKDLPFTRRFFPGGADSIRGYEQDQASPRNAQGKIVGAETYTLSNVEIEQGITPKWAVVGFLDVVTFAEELQDYPGNVTLYSIGTGLRWKTIVGPVRLEYGYNLNPRKKDPTGTLQFSLGFPF